MDNGIDKKALFKLKSEPYLKPISDLGVGFYNLDENTAILRFQLSNAKGPLLIHKNNLTAYAYFESSNGSASDVIELEIEDSFNGIVTITLDKDFLQASTSTSVKGQVYIGVNNVDGNPEYNEVAVFREFTFEVADALINKISSFTKIEYIRMFDQLKMRIEQKVKDIEEAIANGADYVAEMKSVLQKGVETLNTIVADGKEDIQSFITQAKTDLNKVADDATEDITTTANNAKSSVEDTASTAVNNINSKATEATEHVDSKVDEFNQTVEGNGFLSSEILDEQLESLNWQKYKLTDSKGHQIQVRDIDFNTVDETLSPGFYWVSGGTNGPVNINGFLTLRQGTSSTSYIKAIFEPFNTNDVYVRTKNANSGWTEWQNLASKQTDTGWVPFNLINGAKTNTAYTTEENPGFKCAYRIIKNGEETKRMVRINGSNLTHNQVIAQLPETFVKNAQAFPVRVPASDYTGYVVFKVSGEVSFVISGDRSLWNENGYAYGECSWSD
ncbi:BppU family phage baseplate upper protein [Staphylococcus sp. GDY8P19P]|uniref:BppU family phage baseplate upper protein n=1 Tax=Staphylococcus sp. GDY8P19P TaxID=2804415 RepID=UPI00194ECE4D|nr:BppU family phage baseplate upper protein [Staphylococcus sp. GDY8P19P]